MSDPSETEFNRRDILRGVSGGAAATLAGCSFFDRGDDGETTAVEGERARQLAEQFAPALYFDRNEKWFPTDPRPYESERDGQTVVDGFDAFNGYVEAGGSSDVPEPSVFYNVVEYEQSPLAVVQFWLYSAFDQFATNFHWHDWELLQVFVDTDSGDPQLYVASAHSRSAPNNEHLDPDPQRRPRLLSELGSHSSGLSVNDDPTGFQRLPENGELADITNSVVDGIEDIAAIPLAYGLPRDEGLALPYLVPELDGEPVYEHPDLPAVAESDLVSEELTIQSFEELRSPPTNLPERETGLQFEYEGRDQPDADERYRLVPTAELEHIESFTGEQLSFPFAVPEFGEDLVADHITTTGVPWNDPRYEQPATDITETDHRQALANRYDDIAPPSQANQVIAKVTNVVSAEEAPEGEGLASVSSPLELFALFQSEPKAVPTFQGLAVLQDVPEGEHTLTVNGAGVAPHSETVTVSGDGETTLAGADGEIPAVANENATKLEVDPRDSEAELRQFAVEDDFAGRLYDAPLSGPDAVYVHEGGAFTAEVRDTDDEIGAIRVNPDPGEAVRIERPETGKESLASYLADIAEETRAQVAAAAGDDDVGDSDGDQSPGADGGGDDTGGQENAVQGLTQALEAVVEAAERAAERARANDRANTDQQLAAVATRLERVGSRLAAARDSLPPGIGNAAENRLAQARRRSEQARQADKL
ncbi:hypothetical protein GRX03_06595 [Halovenus sp. WSH3]|uniref:Uncharacterized protein n=1 Tax=Halovenus carboxidivorans TaxID=2692199 RepID=A0A6B0T7J3_9EURY|nr:hypothetical protein [Halovenus carboxidivorans]MXR51272.1 hypothetical protein [Halovenus carboxidivorans]